MALEQLVNGMTGQQLANTIKNNFDKVLDVESAENKAENAGKALKTDYDATRYVEMELADGTPIRMRWDVFCQAIASVVAELISYQPSLDLNELDDMNNLKGLRNKVVTYSSIFNVNPSNLPSTITGRARINIKVSNVADSYICQEVVDASTSSIYVRFFNAGTWGSWGIVQKSAI